MKRQQHPDTGYTARVIRPLVVSTLLLVPGALLIPGRLHAQGPIGRGSLNKTLDKVLDASQTELLSSEDLWVDRTSWETPFEVYRPNLVVQSTKSYRFTKEIADGQQAMLGWFRKILGQELEPRIMVRVRPDRDSYTTIGEEIGGDHSSFYGSFSVTSEEQGTLVESVWDPLPDWNRETAMTVCQMQITHSLAHAYIEESFRDNALPAWVEEGLCEYFTSYWQKDWLLGRLKQLRESKRELLFDDLQADDVSSFNDSNTDRRLLQLAGMFIWLMDYREDTRVVWRDGEAAGGAFRDYLITGLQGREVNALPFQKVIADPEQLAKDFAAWEIPSGGR